MSSSLLFKSLTFFSKLRKSSKKIKNVEKIKKFTGLTIPTKLDTFLTNSIFKLNKDRINNKNNQIRVFSIFTNFF